MTKFRLIPIAVLLLAAGTHAYAMTDSLNTVSDFRITEKYMSLVYGSLNSELMQYKGNDSGITFDAGIHINTTGEFAVNTREDMLDAVAAEANGKAGFTAELSVASCETLGITVETADSEVINLWEGTPAIGENTISVVSMDGCVSMLLNGNIISAAKCSGVPTVTIYGTNAVLDITAVSYAEAQNAVNLIELLNSTIDVRSTFELCMNIADLDSQLYQKLPECDKNTIAEKIAAERPFSDVSAIKTSYEKIVSNITRVDTSKYAELIFEDFEDGLDTGLWTVFHTPVVLADGSDPFGGNGNATSNALEGSSLVTAGASLGRYGGISYDLPISECVVKLYFYDNKINNPAAYAVQINDILNIGMYDKYVNYIYRLGTTVKTTSIARSVGWHKIELDTINQNGLCVYIDGTLVYSDEEMKLEKIFIGNCYSFKSFSWVSTDNISVAVPDGTVIADIPHDVVLKGENAVKVTKYTTDGNYDVTADYQITCQSEGFAADGVAAAVGETEFEAQVSGDDIDTVLSKTLYVTNDKRVYISDAEYSTGTLSVTVESDGKTDSAALATAVFDTDGTMCCAQIAELADIKNGSNAYAIDITDYPDGGEIKVFLMSSVEEIKPIYTAVKAKIQ